MAEADSSSKIIIIGAGIAGLALAQGLKKASAPFHLYERSPSAFHRAQGYRIRINEEGARALKQCLDTEGWATFLRTCPQIQPGMQRTHAVTREALPWKGGGRVNLQAADADAADEAPEADDAGGPYNVDRTVIRSVLLLGLEAHVSFSKEFTSYETSPSGSGGSSSVTARFADGTSTAGALLVAADGLHSRARKQLLPQRKIYDTEGRCIYGKAALTAELRTEIARHKLDVFSLARDDAIGRGIGLLTEPVFFRDDFPADPRLYRPEDYLYVVLFWHKADQQQTDAEIMAADPKQLAAALTAHWHPLLRAILDAQVASQTAVLRISTSLPALEHWDSGPVTLIGDAIHPMSPTGGVGANTGLRDAAVLSRRLASEGVGLQAVRRYETAMRSYARAALAGSEQGARNLFSCRPFEELPEMQV